MTLVDFAALAFIVVGAAFFVAGTVGVLRLPDTLSRLHALTKADGLGLALICIGIMLLADSTGETVRLVMIWFFAALSSAVCAHLVARHLLLAERSGGDPGDDR